MNDDVHDGRRARYSIKFSNIDKKEKKKKVNDIEVNFYYVIPSCI